MKPLGIRYLKRICKYTKRMVVGIKDGQHEFENLFMSVQVEDSTLTVTMLNHTINKRTVASVKIEDWNNYISKIIKIKKPYSVGLAKAVDYAYENLLLGNFK